MSIAIRLIPEIIDSIINPNPVNPKRSTCIMTEEINATEFQP